MAYSCMASCLLLWQHVLSLFLSDMKKLKVQSHNLCLFFLYLLSKSVNKNLGLEVQQVIIISRHGSRESLTKHHTTFLEGANSRLTVRGMDQMFRAGKYVRQLYNKTERNFFSVEYNASEVYVRSSDYERTLNRCVK
jgi:hypothetical protein